MESSSLETYAQPSEPEDLEALYPSRASSLVANAEALAEETRSFSDPDGYTVSDNDLIVRTVSRVRWPELEAFLNTPVAHALSAEGLLVETEVVAAAEDSDTVVLRHPRIWFPTFPYEWIAAQLADAGRATLAIQQRALEAGFELKDASPYNIVFDGVTPRFVDLSSFARMNGTPSWMAYGQFLSTFVHPLLVARHWRLGLAAIFLSEKNPDWGDRLARRLPWSTRWSAVGLVSLTVPYRLSSGTRAKGNTDKAADRDTTRVKEAKRLAMRFLSWQLKRVSRGLTRRKGSTLWGTYRTAHLQHYSDQSMDVRLRTVELWCAQLQPKTLLDIGCNDGLFSMGAAQRGTRVIGVDGNEESLADAYTRAKAVNAHFTPLLMDFARPTPRVGWANTEFASFLERARGQFDMILMMAVVHHLLVSSRLPLVEILKNAAFMSRGTVVLEWVPITDPRFVEVASANASLYEHLSIEYFEATARKFFTIVDRVPLTEGRVLYRLVKS